MSFTITPTVYPSGTPTNMTITANPGETFNLGASSVVSVDFTPGGAAPMVQAWNFGPFLQASASSVTFSVTASPNGPMVINTPGTVTVTMQGNPNRMIPAPVTVPGPGEVPPPIEDPV